MFSGLQRLARSVPGWFAVEKTLLATLELLPLGKTKAWQVKYVSFYIKYVICLRTEHQIVHKTSFRNVRAFQDRIRILIEKLVFEKKTERMTVFANFMERKNAIVHYFFPSAFQSIHFISEFLACLFMWLILRVWHFFSLQ